MAFRHSLAARLLLGSGRSGPIESRVVGLLKNVGTGRQFTIRGRCLVGRSMRADLTLEGKGSSMEHATITWDGSQWSLKDLTSRNGTRVNQTLLVAQTLRLAAGDQIVFGDPAERWVWHDEGAPIARVVRLDGTWIGAQTGLLLLPDEDQPCASLCARGEHWELEVDGVSRPVLDGESVDINGVSYKFDLPSVDPRSELTRTLNQRPLAVAACIHFEVSSDEEHVAVTLEAGSIAKELPTRALNYMLLVLARARAADEARGCASQDAGWLYVQDLARQLKASVETLNVDVHRARRAVGRLALLEDPVNIVERRRASGQMRIGIPTFEF